MDGSEYTGRLGLVVGIGEGDPRFKTIRGKVGPFDKLWFCSADLFVAKAYVVAGLGWYKLEGSAVIVDRTLAEAIKLILLQGVPRENIKLI